MDDYQEVALTLADWQRLSSQVAVRSLREHLADRRALVEVLAEADIVVTMRERTLWDAALFDALPRLRLLVTTGMRNAAIDLTAAERHGVIVCGTEGFSQATAELTWTLILAVARCLVDEALAMRTGGPWQSTLGVELHGKHLGLIGLGRIGSQVARVGQAFGMRVGAWSPHLTRERADAAHVQYLASQGDLLAWSDVVSLHMVLSETTRGLLGEGDLARMKPGAFLINTSRAGIVDQDALIEALTERRIAGAGLDVFETEPLPPDHPYRALPNVVATPHIGYVSRETYVQWYEQIADNIEAFLAGDPRRVIRAT